MLSNTPDTTLSFPARSFITCTSLNPANCIICDTCLRCSPFMASPEDVARGVHGTDERISLRSYAQGIRVLIHLMDIAAIAP